MKIIFLVKCIMNLKVVRCDESGLRLSRLTYSFVVVDVVVDVCVCVC